MSQYIIDKVENIVGAGTSFGSPIESKAVSLANYQSAKIVINSGAGEEKTAKGKIVAILPDATEQDIKEFDVAVGGNKQTEINLVANEIAHYDATEFKVKIEAVDASEVTGAISVVLSQARYSEE